MKYGRLTVISTTERLNGKPAYLCLCDCGKYSTAFATNIRSGNTKSCGCLGRQRGQENLALGQAPTHGMTNTKEWRAWMGMKVRTGYDHPKSRKYYLEQGIKVCPEWEHDFLAFYNHIGPAPKGRHSVDRVDSNGHYEPGNVRWATDRQQNRNKSDNVKIVWRGQERLLIEVVQELGLPYQTISHRIQRAGWPVDKAITQPVRHFHKQRNPQAMKVISA
jgi:hypothetical protein